MSCERAVPKHVVCTETVTWTNSHRANRQGSVFMQVHHPTKITAPAERDICFGDALLQQHEPEMCLFLRRGPSAVHACDSPLADYSLNHDAVQHMYLTQVQPGSFGFFFRKERKADLHHG